MKRNFTSACCQYTFICEFLNVFASLYRFYAPKYAAVNGLRYPNIGAIAYDHGINSMAAAQSLLKQAEST
ncbi:MAG: hypothetical protein U9O54_03255, partial [Chloroflexota bacterium]|nr:hypothetical protein [Chloroflexota bacterium]